MVEVNEQMKILDETIGIG